MRSLTRPAALVLGLSLLVSADASAQPARPAGKPPSIEDKTASMKKLDGFIPVYWDETEGKLYLEVSNFGVEILQSTGFAAGLGSNDIGIDRGALAGSRIVMFERVGPKVLLVAPNYNFRATSDNAAEHRSVKDAFARSVLWGFTVAAESAGRVLVDATPFLIRDNLNLGPRLRPGTYRLDESRSSVYMPGTFNFPKNSELEVELTYAQQQQAGPPQGGAAPGPGQNFGGGNFFEGVRDVAATGEAASLRIHHSFVELPGSGFKTRAFDPRSGFFGPDFQDRSAPLGTPLEKRFIGRHRLAKADPKAKISDPVKPIIYYLDPGTPEPIRSALLDGARWWNQAFEAAGYRDAFRVEVRPENVHPLDIRYNVINWVHRSTRGWSTGGSVSDPRTGEIIKGVVTLGSLRVRQDYLIAEALLQPYKAGTEVSTEAREWALARMRQLSAHEVGHTLGLGHNYYDSDAGRISVMDYPHPLVTLKPDGSLDISKVYDVGIGAWDKVAITYGYQDFPAGADEKAALGAILDAAWQKDIKYMSNQDMGANPRVDWWSNGTDAGAELARMMDVRRAALSRFGEAAIQKGAPMAMLEEALVPLYMHHRYQVEAAASVLGGQHYIYAMRGDGRVPTKPATAAEQKKAFEALLTTLKPSELKIPESVLKLIPPRPSGYGVHRELFPRFTGSTFDAITPAVVAADHTLSFLFDSQRAARMVEQKALDPTLPGFDDLVNDVVKAAFGAQTASSYEAEIARSIERVVVDRLMDTVADARMPQVRAIAQAALGNIARMGGSDPNRGLMASDIERFNQRPLAAPMATMPVAPPGAPIGDPGMDFLPRMLEPFCSQDTSTFALRLRR
ncbi:MAG TPA: zinc-dependent metalloprotease [Vicinamibacteria bacterium]|nr:zinc-dependent metalloprotease [Vicinamibacteria bacterium]